MEITDDELKGYLKGLGIDGNFNDLELSRLKEEVQKRIYQEYTSNNVSMYNSAYNSQYQSNFQQSQRPQNYNTSGNVYNVKNYYNNGIDQNIEQFGDYNDEFQKPESIQPKQAQQKEVLFNNFQHQQNANVQKQNDNIQQRPQSAKLNPEKQEIPKKEQDTQQNYNLDHLANQILETNQYQTYEQPKLQQMQAADMLKAQQTAVQKSLQQNTKQQNTQHIKQQQQYNQKYDQVQQQNISDKLKQSQSDRLQYDEEQQKSNYQQRKQQYQQYHESCAQPAIYHQQFGDNQIISKYIGPQKCTRQELINKKADPVDRYNHYQKIWSIQGAPQDRRKRMLDAKASKLINKVMAKRDVERVEEEHKRRQELQALYGENYMQQYPQYQ